MVDRAAIVSTASAATTSRAAQAAVRVPLWRGVQPVVALWFRADAPKSDASKDDASKSDASQADARAARMLAHWRTGAKALRFAEGDLLRYPSARWLDCDALPALALCLDARGALTSAPLRPDERGTHDENSSHHTLAASDADLLIVGGARVLALRQADGAPLDLSRLIDIDDYALREPFDCSAAVPMPDASKLVGRQVRELLGDKIPPPSAERDAFLERLSGRGRDGSARGGGAPGERMRAVGQDWLGRFAARWLGGFAALGAAAGGMGQGGQGTNASGVHERQRPVRPSRLRDALTRLAIASRMSRLIGWRHGAYLRKMLQMFEDGDLLEALRHALPIDATGQTRGQAFSAPGRRNDLRLSGASDIGTEIGLPDELREHLRTVYRQTFERLDRAGKVDEALFVLAELLNAKQEALDYLERHGRHAQAAELALAWDMPPTTIVRLLLLAGDFERAVQAARRDGEFASVVAALEKDKPALAIKLRLAWGEALAERGQWLAAMDAVWPVPEARDLAFHWLRMAETAGETLSARALVRRAERFPDTLERYGERLLALANPERETDARRAMAEALLETSAHNAATRAVASAILPALIADRADSRHDLSKARLKRLLQLADDPWLNADAPELSVPQLKTRIDLWDGLGGLRWDAPAVGLRAIYDAAALDDHRYLIALGEAGAAVIDRGGRTLRRYDVPAYALTIGDSRNIALAVAPREHVTRVSRLDLVRHSVADLGALPITAHADAFDGIAWSLVSRDRILVVDTAKSLQDALWHVGDLPGPIVQTRYLPNQEIYLIRSGEAFEIWVYQLPNRRLLSRDTVRIEEGHTVALIGHGQALQFAVLDRPDADDRDSGNDARDDTIDIGFEWYRQPKRIRLRKLEGETAPSIVFQPLSQGALFGLRGERRAQYGLYRYRDGTALAEFDWPTSVVPRVRETPDGLLLFDQEGRVLSLARDGTVRDTISVR
ncbi:MAG: hypothetical protein KA144_11720 [Xanthomonadaceae bacterium]|nr:hypothetical protein [Xanthomonadaceae bacterium]